MNIMNWITMTRKSAEHLRTIYGNTGHLFRSYFNSQYQFLYSKNKNMYIYSLAPEVY